MPTLRTVLGNARRLLGLGGDISFGWQLLTKYVLPNGAGAILITAFLDSILGFGGYVADLWWPIRLAIYLSVLVLVFTLVSHIRQHLPALLGWYSGPSHEERELEAQERWHEGGTLDDYRNRMEELLHDEDRPLRASAQGDEVRVSAQERTLAILRRLSPEGKREVLQFLYRRELIETGNPIIDLNDANLRKANLADLKLPGACLEGADLREADLSGTELCDFVSRNLSWVRALKRGGALGDLLRPVNAVSLESANLSGAILKRARLNCSLQLTNLRDADLDRADIRGANLRGARNLTQEQIEKAYGSIHQGPDVPNTLLQAPLRAPEAWEKLLSQQVEERGEH